MTEGALELEVNYTIVRGGPYNKKRHPAFDEGLHTTHARADARRHTGTKWYGHPSSGEDSAMNHLRASR